MRVTRHPYEIAGWGVGELWIGDGEVVVAHDPPTPGVSFDGAVPQTTPRGTPGVPTETLPGSRHGRATASWRNCSSGCTATSPASGSRSPTSRSTRTGRRRSRLRSRRRCAPSLGRGRQLRRALRPRRAVPVPPAQPARSAPRTASRCSCRAIASSPAAASAATARSESSTSGGCSRSRARGSMGLSDDLRSELAAISPDRGCCRLAEVSALFHSAGSVHLRGRGRVALHLDVATSGVARRAFSLLRQLGIHSEIRTYSRRSFDRATRYQLHVSGDESALAALVEAGVLDARHAPLERPPKRVVGRACCRGAYLRGAILGGGSLSGPRAPHLELRTTSLEGAEFLRSVAAADDVRLGVLDRGRHAVAYAKGLDAIESVLTPRRRDRHRPLLRGAIDRRGRAWRGEPARERRPRQPRPHESRGAGAAGGVPAAPGRRQRSSGYRTGCTRSPACVSATRSYLCASSRPSASPRRARHPSTAASENCRIWPRPNADFGSEATLQGSWRGSGSAPGDFDPDCALSKDRRAGGGAPRTTSPSACRAPVPAPNGV